jgi:FAD/FMN-containing dehydrogenase
MFSSLGPSVSTLFANPSLPALPHGMVTHAEPIHPHAYVTFGAGMRQKEIDRYTAANPLEATSLSGMPTFVPYHVPLYVVSILSLHFFIPCSDSSAHPVGSSIMLLGGFGFLGRLYGLSIDNLVEVEMVLADGKIIIVNEHEHTGGLIYYAVVLSTSICVPRSMVGS